MKIADVRLTGLVGGTVEGGWADELAPEDNVHTVVEVLTEDGRVGLGSTFTSSHLVAAATRLLRPWGGGGGGSGGCSSARAPTSPRA
jgi:L-alanine-DL-glutamate epimerase-like enolase superfamily enzyme